jgi:sec-independent protein translocase protein TatA
MVRHLAQEGPMDAPFIVVPAFIGLESGVHWIIILVVALLLFGRRLPEIMRGLGGSIREFKKGIDEGGGSLDGQHSNPDGAMSRQAQPPALPPTTAPPATPPVDERAHTQPANEPPKNNP